MKAVLISYIVLIMVFQSISFATGLSYSIYEDQNHNLPISHVLYVREDGTLCVENFEDPENQNNILVKVKDLDNNISVTKCSSQELQQINATINQSFYNANDSFKATTVSLSMMATTGIVSASFECIIGTIGSTFSLVLYGDQYRSSVREGSAAIGNIFGVAFGLGPVIEPDEINPTARSRFFNGLRSLPLGAVAGGLSAVICNEIVYTIGEHVQKLLN